MPFTIRRMAFPSPDKKDFTRTLLFDSDQQSTIDITSDVRDAADMGDGLDLYETGRCWPKNTHFISNIRAASNPRTYCIPK